jgi:hypothetical protein
MSVNHGQGHDSQVQGSRPQVTTTSHTTRNTGAYGVAGLCFDGAMSFLWKAHMTM